MVKVIQHIAKLPAYKATQIRTREKISYIIHWLLSLTLNFRIEYLNKLPVSVNQPVVFACNHSNVHDFPACAQILGRHFYLIASDEVINDIGGLFFWLNGVIWVNRENKESRKQIVPQAVELLKKGKSILIFPEGIWNISPALPMLPIGRGCVRMSVEARVPIVPIALEYDKKVCRVLFGEPLQVWDKDEAEACAIVRDKMASLRWEIWERFNCSSRNEITVDDYNKYAQNRIKEWGKLTAEEFNELILQREPSPEEVFSHLNTVSPSLENAFLFRK